MDIFATQQTALTELEAVTDQTSLQSWNRKYLGKDGEVTAALKQIGKMPKDERAELGKNVNAVKEALTTAHEEREAVILQQELARSLRGRG
jgi:phenylalanyl-tRNA synthetase alpha chain